MIESNREVEGPLEQQTIPSPFPGMNPYLEQETVWHSLHEQFPAFCQEELTAQVRPKYFVKLDIDWAA
jgi:hypothetical protein